MGMPGMKRRASCPTALYGQAVPLPGARMGAALMGHRAAVPLFCEKLRDHFPKGRHHLTFPPLMCESPAGSPNSWVLGVVSLLRGEQPLGGGWGELAGDAWLAPKKGPARASNALKGGQVGASGRMRESKTGVGAVDRGHDGVGESSSR